MKYNNLKPSFIAFLLLLGTSTPPAYAQYITEYEQDYELCQKVGGDVSGPFCYLRGELGYFEMVLDRKDCVRLLQYQVEECIQSRFKVVVLVV